MPFHNASIRQCAQGLVCYARAELEPVPGCPNGQQDVSRTDYCIPENLVPPASSRNAGSDFFLIDDP